MISLSHRPTLITILIAFWGFKIYSIKNATRVRLEPTTFESLINCLLPTVYITWPLRLDRRTRKLAGFNLLQSSNCIQWLQLNYWPCVIVCSLLQGCGFKSSCSRFFFISVFNLGIANGAKVGLKLRLAYDWHRDEEIGISVSYFAK